MSCIDVTAASLTPELAAQLEADCSPESTCPMAISFEQALIDDRRQVLVDHINEVKLGKDRYPIRLTLKRRWRQVGFTFDGNEIRGLEQRPQTKSRWAQMSCSGNKVMQFLSEGHYVAKVVDAKVTMCRGRAGG
jgi:predicted Zn-ribbon and HTH transcriptional regulator